MKIYVNQSNILLSLITGQSLVSVDTAVIKCQRPDGYINEWTGSINGQLVEYQLNNGDLPVSGVYTLWLHITFTNTKVSISEPQTLTVYEEGT